MIRNTSYLNEAATISIVVLVIVQFLTSRVQVGFLVGIKGLRLQDCLGRLREKKFLYCLHCILCVNDFYEINRNKESFFRHRQLFDTVPVASKTLFTSKVV